MERIGSGENEMKATVWFFLALIPVFAQAGTPRVLRVVHIVFENADYEDVIANPVFKRVSDAGVLFTGAKAVTHPSQPNYIAMVSGSIDGAGTDGEINLDRPHLGDLLEAKGLQWKVYAEGYPGNCFLGMRSGKYVRRHVPFLSFTNVQRLKERCARVVNANQFSSDLQAGALPEYSLYVPDLNHDGHDTGVEFAGQWFDSAFGALFADSSRMAGTLFVITFDESESYFGSNRIFTAFLGANVRPGLKVGDPVGHYSVLALIEELFHLGSLNRQDRTAAKIPDIWQ
ncbi:MAG: hypothetical protein EBX52_02505 [Proteobacteria bacterium]|nr:hypothetical protein [Pseudomonadota bacterium]